MRYHVVYLASGQREATHVEAADAAAAVAVVEAARVRSEEAFELLLVRPDEADE